MADRSRVTAYDAEQAGEPHMLVKESAPGQSLSEIDSPLVRVAFSSSFGLFSFRFPSPAAPPDFSLGAISCRRMQDG
jgi:hypothetical protein